MIKSNLLRCWSQALLGRTRTVFSVGLALVSWRIAASNGEGLMQFWGVLSWPQVVWSQTWWPQAATFPLPCQFYLPRLPRTCSSLASPQGGSARARLHTVARRNRSRARAGATLGLAPSVSCLPRSSASHCLVSSVLETAISYSLCSFLLSHRVTLVSVSVSILQTRKLGLGKSSCERSLQTRLEPRRCTVQPWCLAHRIMMPFLCNKFLR